MEVKTYRGQRVVNFKDIDNVHQRPEGTAKRNFNENKLNEDGTERFVEGEDYFKISRADVGTNFVLTYGFDEKAPSGIIITESGYLMLVKSFTDDLAWKVQRELVNGYFRAKDLNDKIRFLQEFNKSFKVLDNVKGMATHSERRSLFKQLMDGLGFELPQTTEEDIMLENTAALIKPADPFVKEFITEQCIFMPGEFVIKRRMHDAYVDWCSGKGIKPLSIKVFGKNMSIYGVFSKALRCGSEVNKAWVGVALRYSFNG